MPSAHTQLVGVFGHPVGHSLSPAMHNAAFHALGLDYLYLAFDIPPVQLKAGLAAISALGFRGINLTIPHKEAALALVEEVDSSAAMRGAVNTIVNEDGRLRGYNTDGDGFLRSLADENVEVSGRKVVLLGAGGAARGILISLVEAGVHDIIIANRTLGKAQALADMAQRVSGDQAKITVIALPSSPGEGEDRKTH